MIKNDEMNYSRKVVDSIGLRTVLSERRREKIRKIRPRVVVFLSETAGHTDYIRLVGPMLLNDHLRSDSVTFCLTGLHSNSDGDVFNISNLVLTLFDLTIVVSREKISSESLDSLLCLKSRFPKTKIVIDIDDDLFSISESHPEYEHYRKRLEVLHTLIDHADLITVSTEQVLRGAHERGISIERYAVIPNYLDGRAWSKVWAANEKETADITSIRVLYSGTETHDSDLRLIENAISEARKSIEASGKGLEIIVAGGTTLPIPGMNVVAVPPSHRDYPKYVEWVSGLGPFDFAIAPLDLSNTLNHAKSSLKYLDYSAMGVPAIFSPIPSYREVIRNGENGLIVESNDLDAWKNALVELALNDNLRNAISSSCRKDVMENYLLENHYDEWVRAIDSIA